jgi:TusA-related sulfurtransferase
VTANLPPPGEPDLVLDARGLRCPMPVLEIARRATSLPAGTLVALLSDDPAAASDVPAWCAMRGHQYLGSAAAADGGGTTYLVRLGNLGGAGSSNAAESIRR